MRVQRHGTCVMPNRCAASPPLNRMCTFIRRADVRAAGERGSEVSAPWFAYEAPRCFTARGGAFRTHKGEGKTRSSTIQAQNNNNNNKSRQVQERFFSLSGHHRLKGRIEFTHPEQVGGDARRATPAAGGVTGDRIYCNAMMRMPRRQMRRANTNLDHRHIRNCGRGS